MVNKPRCNFLPNLLESTFYTATVGSDSDCQINVERRWFLFGWNNETIVDVQNLCRDLILCERLWMWKKTWQQILNTVMVYITILKTNMFQQFGFHPQQSLTNRGSKRSQLSNQGDRAKRISRSPWFVLRSLHIKRLVHTLATWHSSWWFQPIWKIVVKLDHFPK